MGLSTIYKLHVLSSIITGVYQIWIVHIRRPIGNSTNP